MRMRNKPWALDFLKECPRVYLDNPQLKGQWKGSFEKCILEIGSGKGDYIMALALMHPTYHYIALERDKNVSAVAIKKMHANLAANVSWLVLNADDLLDLFDLVELDEIHLNFSDPWPKKGHAKRRLTAKPTMDKMLILLNAKGVLKLKTDNASLFEYSITELQHYPLDLEFFSVNYHQDEKSDDAYTEYEKRFIALNQPIYRAIWRKHEVK